MKRFGLLILPLTVILVGSVFSWWYQRYSTEADALKNGIRTIQIERENRSLEKAFEQINDIFERTPVRIDSVTPAGDTVAKRIMLSVFSESKAINILNGKNGSGLEVYKPPGATLLDSCNDFKLKLRLDSSVSQANPDTMIHVEFNFFDQQLDTTSPSAYLRAYGDSIGISLRFVSNRDGEILAVDTLNRWYIESSDTKPVERFGKTDFRLIQEYIVIENYRSYLLGGMWPELLAGSSLIAGLLAFFLIVRRDMARQTALLEQKDRLLANVAHELKTPIATVGVALEALQDFGADDQPELRREYTNIARQELVRLDLLAERALRTLQLDAGHLSLNHEPVDLRTLIERAWSGLALKHQLPTNQLCYFTWGDRRQVPGVEAKEEDLSEPLPAQTTIIGDRELLLHLFYNLLDNACKYGGDPPLIEVRFYRKESSVQVDVIDNGAGVPAGDERKIFEKFYRSDGKDGHRVKGHGLGLAYARQIVLAHGGNITYPAGKERSTFSVILPIQ